jgi:hypothetical protein
MGLPGAGKSTAARTFVEQGYERLNRDEDGGSLRGLLPALDRRIGSGCPRMVLDNTYVSRRSRASLIQLATKHGFPVRCIWLSTSLEDAQVNAVSRMVARFGRLLGPEEMREIKDVSAFGPTVQFRYERELEPPHPAEGFSRIETIPFERTREASFTNRALIVWVDGVLGRRRTSGSLDVEVFAERGEILRRYQEDGWRVLGLSWQPQIAEEVLTVEEVDTGFVRHFSEESGPRTMPFPSCSPPPDRPSSPSERPSERH